MCTEISNEPDKQSIEIKKGPLLRLPPVMLFTIKGITLHGIGRCSLGYGLQEHGTPCNIDLLLSQVVGELELCIKHETIS